MHYESQETTSRMPSRSQPVMGVHVVHDVQPFTKFNASMLLGSDLACRRRPRCGTSTTLTDLFLAAQVSRYISPGLCRKQASHVAQARDEENGRSSS